MRENSGVSHSTFMCCILKSHLLQLCVIQLIIFTQCYKYPTQVLFSAKNSYAYRYGKFPENFHNFPISNIKSLKRRIISRALNTNKLHNGYAHRYAHTHSGFISPRSQLDEIYNPNNSTPADTETYQFKAEVSRVMDIIVNSLYTDKDVFLRELISNAADACDKKRFLLLQNGEYQQQGRIRIKADKEMNTLIIEDLGVGMNKTELIHNLGTIAQSGTAKFLQQVAEGTADASLIGQFGVGFYSAYLVANTVEVSSKRLYGDGVRYLWTSTSADGGTFSIHTQTSNSSLFDDTMSGESGTRITLHLKEDADEYLEDYKIKELLRKYSEFITYPIEIWSEKIEYERVPDEAASEKMGAPKMKTVTKRQHEWERINVQPPIWRRPNSEIADEDYNEFYKSTFKAYDDPLGFIHFKVEGQVEFSCVLFIPGTIPWELTRNMFDDQSKTMRLYVKRVFINDKFTDALPRWLTFIRGVVDSEDLPLNVGREVLQKSRILVVINKRITAKAIDMFRNLKAAGGDKWKKFWDNFGKYLKVGVIEDKDNQEDIASLLEFWTTQSDSERRSLDDYIQRMKTNQTAVYFVAGETKQAASSAPALEQLRLLGYEVVYCTDPVDEFCLQSLAVNKYKGYDVIDVNKADLKLPQLKKESETESHKNYEQELESLCDYLHQIYSEKVMKVSVSSRLVESPAVLVQGDFGLSPTMQRYLRQQAASQGMTENEMYGSQINQAVLEINPRHPVIKELNYLLVSKKEEELKDKAWLLFEVACLQGGYATHDAAMFANRVISLMTPKRT